MCTKNHFKTSFNEANEQRMRESKCIELYRLAGRKKCEKNYTITEIKSGDDDDDDYDDDC